MPKFILRPARAQGQFLVPNHDAEPFEVDWKGLCELVAPSKSIQSYRTLRQMRTGGFVGISRPGPTKSVPVNFVFHTQDRSGDLKMVLKKQPDFIRQILRVYQVERMEWDGRMVDMGISHGVPVTLPPVEASAAPVPETSTVQ